MRNFLRVVETKQIRWFSSVDNETASSQYHGTLHTSHYLLLAILMIIAIPHVSLEVQHGQLRPLSCPAVRLLERS